MKSLKNLTIGSLLLVLCPAAGLAGDGVVALQTADPSCPDDSGNIYVDCGNGTVTDNRTGLIWLKDANCLGDVDWFIAKDFVAGLADLPGANPNDCGLSDGSSPGDWRLPSETELLAMIAEADGDLGELDCVPTITNDQGTGCWDPSCNTAGFCSFSDVQSTLHWSSTTSVAAPVAVQAVSLGSGNPTIWVKTNTEIVWPVRGGQ